LVGRQSGAEAPHSKYVAASIIFLILLCTAGAQAQELEPRAYSISPVGTNFVLFAYSRSKGDVLFDPNLPVEDVKASINATSFVFVRAFDFFGRTGQIGVALPYVWGSIAGKYIGEFTSITRSGMPDPSLRFAVNLKGGPALKLRDFARYRQKTNIGFSLLVSAPLGQYDPAKLINLGTNRWTLKPEIGFSRATGKWVFELYGGAKFFGKNKNFQNGSVREQKPVGVIQGHVIYNFRPRLWLAFDGTFYSGGRTTIDGKQNRDLQRNGRIGATLSLPVGGRHSLKVGFNRGAFTNVGSKFSVFSIGYQFFWFGPL